MEFIFEPIISNLEKTLYYTPEKYPMISGVSVSFKKGTPNFIGLNNTQFNKNLIHCEMKALEKYLNSGYKLKTVDICVFRLTRCGTKSNSKPCQKCLLSMLKLKTIKIRNVYYFDSNGTIKCEKLTNIRPEKCIITTANRTNYHK